MSSGRAITVLHYTGGDDDRGGIMSVIRALAASGGGGCMLGVNRGARQQRQPALPAVEFPPLAAERIGPLNWWRARGVARAVRSWLAAEPGRIFHGHSRAGLLVALWLHAWGEQRLVVSVHCYGRQRWFYRAAARGLGARLYWLSPAMREYYGVGGEGWTQCIPGGVPASRVIPAPPLPRRLRLGGIGALVRRKRWHDVLAALATLPPEARARVSFTHIGDGDAGYLAELRAQAARTGLETQVSFRGPEASSDRLLGEIDALVVAGEREPFSIALLEALAAGVPAIAADSGGNPDVIASGLNGILYRTGDPADLAGKIRAWLADPPAWNREKIRGTTLAIDRVAAQWAGIYSGL
ncbi:MAG: epsD 1 [Lacunisphaera sp.]|nr:epsD 1 [Lacunisphaera sp.]